MNPSRQHQRQFLSVILLLSLSSWLSAADFFDDSWGNLSEDLSLAQSEGKQGLVLFYESDDCPFCARMKAEIFIQTQVQDFYKTNFRILPIDIEGDTELTTFTGEVVTSKIFAQKHNRVRATPVIIFYDLQGKTLYRHTGPVKNAQEFLWLGEYILNKTYDKQRFSLFLRAKRKAHVD